jgi:hypothetical protein
MNSRLLSGWSTPNFIILVIANFTEKELTLTRGSILVVAQEISENLVVSAMRKALIEVQNRYFFWKQ